MNKLFIVLMLTAINARAEWNGFSLPDRISANPVGGREFINGQWVAGYGIDVLYYQIPGSLNGHALPKLYLAADHEWNAAELIEAPSHANGLWGPALGVSIGGLASKAQAGLNGALNLIHDTGAPVVSLPAWITNDLDKWVTIEAGAGNRIFGRLNGVKPWGAWIGGKVSIAFDVNAHH